MGAATAGRALFLLMKWAMNNIQRSIRGTLASIGIFTNVSFCT